jgi:sugar lactone lactonase YvrE
MLGEFQPVNDVSCELGESPVYDDRRQAVWYCDILRRLVICHSLGDKSTRSWSFDSEVGSIGLARSGRIVVALRHEVGLFDPDNGDFQRIAEIEPGRAETRTNDGKVGPDGAFWVGTMDDRDVATKEPIATLYRVTLNGAEKKVEGVIISNGLAFSPDGTAMFHSDSRGKWIDRWSFDAKTGAIANRRRIANLDDATGRPDGGAADAEGCYWSAGVSAARLNRFSPEGKLLASYPVPVGAPTMPCFAGPDLKTLFVTSLRSGRTAELLAKYPLTGTLIAARAEVAGTPVTRFNDG